MNPVANFVAVLSDLDKCSAGFDQYELMRIPGLLRLLLLDGLVDQVNREFRQRLRYRVGATIEPKRDEQGHIIASATLFHTIGDSFDPDHLGGVPVHESYTPPVPREVTEDEFLKLYILSAGGHYYSVKELLDNLAYVHGLVHPGQPSTPIETELLGWRQVMQIGGVSAGLREIRSVGRVVHRGLLPLRDAVLQKYATAKS